MGSKIGVILMAYGTPERKEDIKPYLNDIMHGREAPNDIIDSFIEKYESIGFSPLRQVTEKQAELLENTLKMNVAVGMKHWKPSIAEGIAKLKTFNSEKIIGLVAHPFSSIAGSEEYKKIFNENVNGNGLFINNWHANEELYSAWREKIGDKVKEFKGRKYYTIFSSHGLPLSVDDVEYKRQLCVFSEKLAHKSGINEFCLAYQNGEHKAWYTPEVKDKLAELSNKGIKYILLIPVGYISESLETLYDIDIDYMEYAKRLGINLKRVACPSTSESTINAMAKAIRQKLNEKNL